MPRPVGVYAQDGSLNVTLAAGAPTTITQDSGRGVLAPDGSIRVTIVSASGDEALVSDNMSLQVPVTGTYTNTIEFTVSGGEITGVTLS